MANRFVVSTTHHVLAIDPEEGRVWRLHSGAGLYFGLACGGGSIYVACRNSVGGPEDEDARRRERGSILVFDRRFRVCGELQPDFPLRDVHGMTYFDGCLWVTCSFDNLVAIYDTATGAWGRWYPAPNPADRGRDVHHFNTVRAVGRQLCLLAHHFGPSELLFYDYPSLQLESVIPLGRMSHDIFFFRNAIAACSSGDGCIVNRQGERLRTGNFPRGVATCARGHLVGISIHSPRSARPGQDGVLRWYTSDWRLQADWVLPAVGMVLDILEISEGGRAWESLEPWPQATTCGEYNRTAPGNVYSPDWFAVCAGNAALEWHASEGTHIWSAARTATLPIVINPGETSLWVEVGSASPFPYFTEIWMNDERLGTVRFPEPGVQLEEFAIPPHFSGSVSLSFRVPHLWKPSEALAGSRDERLVGIAVHSVGLRIRRESAQPSPAVRHAGC